MGTNEFSDEEIINTVQNYYTNKEKITLNLVRRGIKGKDDFLSEVKAFIVRQYPLLQKNQERLKQITTMIEKSIWGYGLLDELISDPDISDIKVTSPLRPVRIKRLGKRMNSEITFSSVKQYKQYVDLIAVQNNVNISTNNAVQSFTDTETNPDFILRINICTEYVNSVNYPYLHIRKTPKEKYTLERLIEKGMLTCEEAEYLKRQVKESSGMIFAGKGGSGKTTLMNALLEWIPHAHSGLVIQENDELFSHTHPDLMFQRIVTQKNESKIKYLLKDLARNGLLTDLDYFIIGELKGEALYFLNASYTGHMCWASIHGMSSTEAMNKLADYIKYDSDYSREDILRMLISMRTIVYLENFKICEISEVIGYQEGELVFQPIFNKGVKLG